MKAMVFAAGLGTRLRPITDSLPKALVRVGGEPLLCHVLKKLAASGYDEAVVNVHHFADKIREYLDGKDFGLKVSISDETDLLRETGGALKHAEPLLGGDGPFLVHNVDIVSDLDLGWFRKQCPPDALATLLVSSRETKRYFLFDKQMRLVGWTNVETGEVRSPFPGLRAEDCTKLAFSGIHNISPAVFDAFRQYGCPERFPIVDFYLRACKDYPIYGVAPERLTLVDVGKIETLQQAEKICETLLA